jgi:hypothetical protein
MFVCAHVHRFIYQNRVRVLLAGDDMMHSLFIFEPPETSNTVSANNSANATTANITANATPTATATANTSMPLSTSSEQPSTAHVNLSPDPTATALVTATKEEAAAVAAEKTSAATATAADSGNGTDSAVVMTHCQDAMVAAAPATSAIPKGLAVDEDDKLKTTHCDGETVEEPIAAAAAAAAGESESLGGLKDNISMQVITNCEAGPTADTTATTATDDAEVNDDEN